MVIEKIKKTVLEFKGKFVMRMKNKLLYKLCSHWVSWAAGFWVYNHTK